MTSTGGKKTSKVSCPLRSLARAASMFWNVVTSTLQLYFLPKAFRQSGLMYATQLNSRNVAFCSGASPLLIAGLSLDRGQVTGLFGRGSGIPPAAACAPDVVVPPELQPARSEPAPAVSSPAAAPCLRKPRRDSPPARPSSVQPSRGCIPDHLFRGVRDVRGRRQSFLTEHSVNTGTLVSLQRGAQDLACNGSRIDGRRGHRRGCHCCAIGLPPGFWSGGPGEDGEVLDQAVDIRFVMLHGDQPLLDLAPRRQENAAVALVEPVRVAVPVVHAEEAAIAGHGVRREHDAALGARGDHVRDEAVFVYGVLYAGGGPRGGGAHVLF